MHFQQAGRRAGVQASRRAGRKASAMAVASAKADVRGAGHDWSAAGLAGRVSLSVAGAKAHENIAHVDYTGVDAASTPARTRTHAPHARTHARTRRNECQHAPAPSHGALPRPFAPPVGRRRVSHGQLALWRGHHWGRPANLGARVQNGSPPEPSAAGARRSCAPTLNLAPTQCSSGRRAQRGTARPAPPRQHLHLLLRGRRAAPVWLRAGACKPPAN